MPPAAKNDTVPASLEERLAQLEAERDANAARVQELSDQLSKAMARPDTLKSPGEFVGRKGIPDSPVDDHYTLVLANHTLVDVVHPGITHIHDPESDRLIPVVGVYHSPAIHRAQHPAE